MKDKELIILAHVDDRTFSFDSKSDLTLGRKITCGVMAKWGLTVRAGYDDKKSKLNL